MLTMLYCVIEFVGYERYRMFRIYAKLSSIYVNYIKATECQLMAEVVRFITFTKNICGGGHRLAFVEVKLGRQPQIQIHSPLHYRVFDQKLEGYRKPHGYERLIGRCYN